MHIKRKRSLLSAFVAVALIGFFVFDGTPTAFATGTGTNTVSTSPSTILYSSTGNNLTFTYTAAEDMSNGGGIDIAVPNTWTTPQGTSGSPGYTTATTTGTIGRVFDTADDSTGWGGSACSNGISTETTLKEEGTGSVKCINHSESTHDVWVKNISSQDWSSYSTVGFWIYSTAAFSNGNLSFIYANSSNASFSNQLESLSFGNGGSSIPANTWTHVTFTFGATSRTTVQSYGFQINNASVKDATVYLDNFTIGVGTGSSVVPNFSGNHIQVSNISLTNGQTITVNYGTGTGGGATAPSSPETSTFTTGSRADSSVAFSNIASSPTVSVVDQTAPTTTASATAGGAYTYGNWATANVVNTLSCSDGAGSGCNTISYCTDTSNSCTPGTTYTGAVTVSTQGTSYIRYRSTDTSSNTETTKSSTIKVDTSLPTTSDNYGSKDGNWQTANQTITLTPADVTSGIATTKYCTDSNNTCSPSSGTSYSTAVTISTEGTTYFRYASTDTAGNVQTTVSRSVKIDKTNPTVSAGSDQTKHTSFTQTATASDSTAGIDATTYQWAKVSGPGTVAFGSATSLATTISANTDGAYVLSFTAHDNAGNSTTSTFSLTWDATAPTAAITYSINHPVKSGDSLVITATFNEAMVDSPIPKIAISGNNTVSATSMTKSSTTVYTYTYSVGSGDGTDTVALSNSTDAAGNTITSSPTSGATFTVDNTAPTNQNTVFTPSTSQQGNSSVTVISSGDSTNTIWFAPAGTTSFIASTTITTAGGTATSILAPAMVGDYKLFVIDAAGNVSSASSATLTVTSDTTAPTAAITYSISHAVKSGNSLTITATFNEAMADSPIPKIAISGANSVSATNMTKSSSTIYTYVHTVGSGNGTATISLSVGTDLATNVITSTPTSGATFTVDNTAPTNQDTVFTPSVSKQGSATVTVISSGDSTNTIWFAPAGTTNFVASATMTTTGGTATSIAAPATEGDYKLFVIDAAGNISSASTATLTVTNTVPVISLVSATPSNTTATITWTTNIATSSKVNYGPDDSYSSSTAESDTGSRVTSHSISLSGLVACVEYHYSAYSADAATNNTSSDDATFTTSGCRGNSSVLHKASTHSKVNKSAGGSVSLSSTNSASLTIPANFSTSDANFQIKQLDQAAVMADTGTPTGVSATNAVFDFHALSDSSTAVSSFDNSLSMTLTYTDSDVSGLDTSTLKIYRNDGAGWVQLPGCIVDASAKSVSCTTDGFSIFGIFGTAIASASTTDSNAAIITTTSSADETSPIFFAQSKMPKKGSTAEIKVTKKKTSIQLTTKIPQAPTVHKVTVRIFMNVYTLTPQSDKSATYALSLSLKNKKPGMYPYVLSANYGGFVKRQYGLLVIPKAK